METYLVGYGDLGICIFNLETTNQYQYKVKDTIYEKILYAAILVNDDTGKLQCQVACKRKNLNIVSIFDILENHDQIKELVIPM